MFPGYLSYSGTKIYKFIWGNLIDRKGGVYYILSNPIYTLILSLTCLWLSILGGVPGSWYHDGCGHSSLSQQETAQVGIDHRSPGVYWPAYMMC